MFTSNNSEGRQCEKCGAKKALTEHHVIPDRVDKKILCFRCHVIEHSISGDWKVWGRRGGLRTQQMHPHVRKNLKQYREVKNG